MIVFLTGVLFTFLFLLGALLAVFNLLTNKQEWQKAVKICTAVKVFVFVDFALAVILLFMYAGTL